MQLSKFTDYSLRMLMYCGLRQPDEPSTVAAIATAFGISRHHLVKVATRLCGLGYLDAARGPGGGLTMGMPAEEIVLGQVVRATENLALVECMGDGECVLSSACQLQRALLRARAAFLAVLDDVTLADLLQPRAPLVSRLLS